MKNKQKNLDFKKLGVKEAKIIKGTGLNYCSKTGYKGEWVAESVCCIAQPTIPDAINPGSGDWECPHY